MSSSFRAFLPLLAVQTVYASVSGVLMAYALIFLSDVPSFFKGVDSPVGWLVLPLILVIIGGAVMFAAGAVGLVFAFPPTARWILSRTSTLPSFALTRIVYPVAGGVAAPFVGPFLLALTPFIKDTPPELDMPVSEAAQAELIIKTVIVACGICAGFANAIALKRFFSRSVTPTK